MIFVLAGLAVAAGAGAATIVVNDPSDALHNLGCAAFGTGTCTLRDAITFANANAGPDEIDFAIPGSGVHTITLDSDLPAATGDLTIDGYTQPGSSPNTNGPGLGDNAVHLVEINGNGKGCVVLGGEVSTVRGLVVNRCGGSGILVSSVSPEIQNPVLIAGNFIGVDAGGTAPLPNETGILVAPLDIAVVLIGGATPAARNVVSGNRGAGISVVIGAIEPALVTQGNFIGTDATGTTAVPNGGSGIDVEGALFGSAHTEIDDNLVSGNNGKGINLQGAVGAIHGNRIGTDVSGVLPLGNRSTGVTVVADIFGGNVISGNTIAFNGIGDPVGGGIVAGSPSHHLIVSDPTILGNSIFDNTSDGSLPDRGLGIDLMSPGPDPNDHCNFNVEVPGSRSQNSPVLTAVLASGSAIRIRGMLDSFPSTSSHMVSFRIEFFASPTCDPSGYGEGKTFLGFTDVTTDDSCIGEFDVTLPVSAATGQYVTATATDESTSEFSPCQVMTQAPIGILSIAPTSGPAEGGTSVTVEGLGFQAGATASIGGIPTGSTLFGSSTEISTTAPSLTPGTLNDLMITNPDSSSATLPKAWMADFSDVGATYLFHGAVERIFRAAITAGCGNGSYCPDDLVTRAEVAAFIARAMAGGGANVPASGMADGRPYACTPGGGSLFADVAPTDAFCKHVHYLAAQHVTQGCSPTTFCPTVTANREDMAALIAKAIVAPGGGAAVPEGYTDPLSGRWYGCYPDSPPEFQHFTDVTPADPFCKHVHFLWAKGIVSGCGGELPQYCPALTVDRGTMAKFLANAFTSPTGP